jgi:hypothetical protein
MEQHIRRTRNGRPVQSVETLSCSCFLVAGGSRVAAAGWQLRVLQMTPVNGTAGSDAQT